MKKALAIFAATTGAILLIALTALGAREVDRVLTERMGELKSRTMAALESMTRRRITYGEISPSFFRYLEVRDLTIYDSQDSQRALLTIRRIRVYYSLAQLIAGGDPLSALREIRFLNTRLSLDLEADKDVVDLFLDLARSSGGPGEFRARITGANMSIALSSLGTTVSLDNLFFQVEAQQQAITVDLRGSCRGELADGFSFSSALKLRGSLDRSLTSSDLTVHLLSFNSSLFSTGAQTLQLLWKGNSIDIRKIQDRSPVGLSLAMDLPNREFTLNFQAEGLRPDRLFTLSNRFARYARWMSVPLTASGHVTYKAASGSLDYQVDASAYLEDQLPLHQVSVDASFRGSEKEAFFEPLQISSPDGSLEFEGSLLFSNFYPEGLLTLVDVDSGNGQKVNASLSIQRLQASLDVQGSRLTIGELTFGAFRLEVSPSQSNGLAFAFTTSFEGTPQEDVLQASGTLQFGQPLRNAVASGDMGAFSSPMVTLSGALKNIPPDKLYHLLQGAGELTREQSEIYNVLGRFLVTADVSLSTDFSTLSVASRSVAIVQRDDPGTTISFGLTADASHISLRDFAGTWKGLSVAGSFEGQFADGGDQIGFSSNLTFLGTPYTFTGRYSPTLGLYAAGSHGLSISAVPLHNGAMSVQVQGEKFPLPLPGRDLPVSFDVTGIIGPEGDWAADVPSLTIYDVPFLESSTNTIELRGKVTPTTIEVSRAVFTDAYSTLVGSGSASLALPPDIFDPHFIDQLAVQGNLTLKAADGAETYAAKGGLTKGAVNLAVQFDGAPLARIGHTAISGSLSGSGTVAGTLQQVSADLALSLKDGKLGGDPLALGVQATIQQDALRVRSLSVGFLSHKLTEGAGAVDMKNGTFSLTARYEGEYFADKVTLGVGLDGQFVPSDNGPLLPELLAHGLQGRLTMNGITVAAAPFPSWSIAFHSADGKLSFDGGPGNTIHGSIDPQLAFSVALAAPLPLAGSVTGKITGDRISSTVDVETLDLLVLNPILKSPRISTSAGQIPLITVTSGVATGTLVIDGPINDPDFSGSLDIVGGGLLTAYSPDEAGPIRNTLTFDGKSFHTGTITAAAGSARLTSTMNFTIDHWTPVNYDISIATEGQQPARLRARFGRMIADGSGQGQVRIVGSDRRTDVTGSLLVTDCRITLGDAAPGKFVPGEAPTFVNLTAETGKRVEFTWPSESLPVLRTTASPGGKIAVTYRGDTGAYSVKGNVGVQGGEIYYFDRSFIVRKGSISFNEDQTTFDPWITASAEVREWDPNTAEEVKIYLDADSPLSKFSPRFSSDPPRTDAAILAMIGAPLLNKAETQGLGMAALVYSDILSQTWILRPFEQKVRQVLNLDMFSIRTQLLQNLVAQKLFGSTLNPLDNTSVSLGKYLGNDLFLEMLVRLQQQQAPTGISPQTSGLAAVGTGLQPDVELNLEWATPFFLLDWSFLPKHPENLFLTDNSLSFSWRFSY